MKSCDFKKLAQVFVKQYFPEYLNRIDRIWGMLDNVDLNAPQKQFQFGSTLGFAGKASLELREVVSGLVAIRITYEQEKDNAFIPPLELQKLIIEACEKLKVSPDVKVKLEKVTVDFTGANSSNEIVNAIETASSKLKGTIEQEHNATRKTVRKPVISSKFKFNCLISLDSSCREIKINSGFEEITIKLSRVKFELFSAIAQLNKETAGWAGWEEIAKAVPGWSHKDNVNKTDNYIRHRIAELRKALPLDFDGLIESRQGHGYRISTHPDNIFIDPA